MRNDFINISSKDKQYPMYITSIEVDKIINALLGKANGGNYVELGYNDIQGLTISEKQYETVIKDLNNKEFKKTNGYSNMHELLYGIHRAKELGGFHKEMEILQMKLESLHEKANQDEKNAIEEFISKCNELFNGVSNIGGAIDAIKSISLLFGQ